MYRVKFLVISKDVSEATSFNLCELNIWVHSVIFLWKIFLQNTFSTHMLFINYWLKQWRTFC